MANWVADFLTRNPEQAALPIALRAKHSIHFKRPSGQVEANFTGAPCHFLDTDNLWKPLDTKLVAIGAEYGAPGLRARIAKNGLVRIEGGTYSHKSTRIGIFDPTTKSFTSIKTIPLGSVHEDKIIAESGVWRRELTLTETGLREEIVIASLPTGTGAGAGDWLVVETAISGVSVADGWLDEFTADDFVFPPPRASDASGSIAPCKRFARTLGSIQYIYTGIPVSWLADAVYPVTIDPDFAGDAADGSVQGANAAYATARSTSTSIDTAAAYFQLGQIPTYSIDRGFQKWDTSAITAGMIVIQVNQKLTCRNDNSGHDFDVVIKKQDWSAQDPLAAGNREAAFDGCLAAAADDNIWRNTVNGAPPNDFVINTQYTSGNLNTAWVNRTGYTYYSLISSRDVAASAPTVTDVINIYAQEAATAAYRPILTVVYYSGSAFFAFF
jgi:hypothetical protein